MQQKYIFECFLFFFWLIKFQLWQLFPFSHTLLKVDQSQQNGPSDQSEQSILSEIWERIISDTVKEELMLQWIVDQCKPIKNRNF